MVPNVAHNTYALAGFYPRCSCGWSTDQQPSPDSVNERLLEHHLRAHVGPTNTPPHTETTCHTCSTVPIIVNTLWNPGAVYLHCVACCDEYGPEQHSDTTMYCSGCGALSSLRRVARNSPIGGNLANNLNRS